MRVKHVMTSAVASCAPDTNLAAVAELMWDYDCGFVPVVDAAGRIAGAITDRDICIASATRRLLPDQILAAEAMQHSPVHTAHPEDTLAKTLATMKQFRVRRLPVVGADGTLEGVVSMNDIVLAAQEKDGPAAADIVSTLSAICAHHSAELVAA